jgi:hypothetical protein
MQADNLLHARLLRLQQMDREYASLYSEAASDVAVEMARVSIQYTEDALRLTIDSMENRRKTLDDNISGELWKLTTYFKTIMENRRFLTAVKSAGSKAAGNPNDELYLKALQEELRQKEAFIDKLRAKSASSHAPKETGAMPSSKRSNPSSQTTTAMNDDNEEMVYKPAPGESIEELRQRNINLKLAFNNTATELGVLTKKYNLLMKDYQRLSNQIEESSRNR